MNSFVTEIITGLGIRYDLGEGDDLLGRRMRDVELKDGRLYEHMHAGRGVLLDQTGRLSVTGWEDRIDRVVATGEALALPTVLLRPDGHVAWLGDNQEDLRRTIPKWFGAPND